MSLVLSLFPGIGLLDKAFELEGFCVVRGPDVLWGGDVREFHPIAGKFDGVIGGPPCQPHSNLSEMQGTKAVDLVPEFVRIVRESGAAWSVMENVPALWDDQRRNRRTATRRRSDNWAESMTIRGTCCEA